MKIAELFAELGFKVEGADNLKAFETSLQNIANAARQAALALKDLAAARIPKVVTGSPSSGGSGGSPSGNRIVPGMLNFIGPVQPAAYNGALPPKLGQQQQMPNSVLQGLKMLGTLGAKILGFATIAIALKKLVHALTDMVRASMAATFAVDKFTTQTGLSRRELKQWEHVAALSDVKTEELQETLKQLQQRSRQIRFTGEGATPFLQLGINATASPTEIMKQFAKRTAQMDTATAVFFGSQMGISENMVYLLRKNADKIDQLIPNAELNDSDQAAIMQLNAAWKEMIFNVGLLRDKLVADVAPAIKWVADQIGNWAKIFTASKVMRDWILHGGPLNPAATLSTMSHSRSGNTTKVENNVNVDVSGSDRPKETARETSAAIRRELSDSYYGRVPAML